MLSPELAVVLAEFGWYGGGKPTLGGGTWPAATEVDQARWCRRAVETTRSLATGWLNWGLSNALRLRFRIRMPNDNCCHNLSSAGSIRFGSLGAGTLVSATSRHHGGTPMPSRGPYQPAPPRARCPRRCARQYLAGKS